MSDEGILDTPGKPSLGMAGHSDESGGGDKSFSDIWSEMVAGRTPASSRRTNGEPLTTVGLIVSGPVIIFVCQGMCMGNGYLRCL